MILTHEELAQMQAQAIREYPAECCGFVLLRESSTPGRLIFPCRNVQNQLHEKDPKEYPRDAKTAYRIHSEDAKTAFDLEREGYRVAVLYHSHIDADIGAYFSDTDKEEALMDGQPAYPGLIYVVLSVVRRKVVDVGAFQWDSTRSDFVRIELTTT